MSCATMNPIVKVFEGKNITFSSINSGDRSVPLIVVKGSDLAKALGYSYAKKLYQRLDSDYKITDDKGVVWLTEPGVYQAIFGSHLESAKAFHRWAYEEAYPTFRGNGYFVTPELQPALDLLSDEIDLLRAYATADCHGRARLKSRIMTVWKKQVENGNSLDRVVQILKGNSAW